ncbi:hypothetical protein KXW19_004494, partial [Aspergillus fumigatus]
MACSARAYHRYGTGSPRRFYRRIPEEAPAGLARAYANGNEILGIITPPSSVTDWYAMVQLFGHPSAPWPWDRARALWTAFGIFMPFVFDLSLAKAKDND